MPSACSDVSAHLSPPSGLIRELISHMEQGDVLSASANTESRWLTPACNRSLESACLSRAPERHFIWDKLSIVLFVIFGGIIVSLFFFLVCLWPRVVCCLLANICFSNSGVGRFADAQGPTRLVGCTPGTNTFIWMYARGTSIWMYARDQHLYLDVCPGPTPLFGCMPGHLYLDVSLWPVTLFGCMSRANFSF